MAANLDKYQADLSRLIRMGDRMGIDLRSRTRDGSQQRNDLPEERRLESTDSLFGTFESEYQRWYTEATAVIAQLLPSRLNEFESLYLADSRRKDMNASTYSVQDWLVGRRSPIRGYSTNKMFNDFAIAGNRFFTQLEILRSVEGRFASSLFDIRQIVQADLFDSELDAARELSKNGYDRASGTMAGVVLEKHLAQACSNHKLSSRKRNPGIGDYNDLLKDNNVIDIPNWRFIQRLGDLRNLCGHNKDREPARDEVTELIDGVEKITKTLF